MVDWHFGEEYITSTLFNLSLVNYCLNLASDLCNLMLSFLGTIHIQSMVNTSIPAVFSLPPTQSMTATIKPLSAASHF